MSTGEDEPSLSVNGRLRPRKSNSSTTSSPQNKNNRKTEGKLAQDRPKRSSTPSKASPAKQDDLVTQSDAAPAPLFLCPYCERKFNTRQTVSKHARRIHLSTSKQDNFIKCLYCNHSDAESNGIIKHMVDSHPNQYFACLDCHTRFPSTTELAEHKHDVCEKQKPTYRSRLRQNTSPRLKKNQKKPIKREKSANCNESTQLTDNHSFNGIVISCELKPSDMHDETDIEDKITTNLILPSSKTLGNTPVEKNAVIVLDDLQWNKRIPPNFSFHNSDADQILSRLGVVHRSPRVGESRKDLIRIMDEPNEKFEKCFDTSFYSKVAKNVQENLAKYLDGTFNFNPNKDTTIKTRKSKASVMINTAEGFPILLAHEQFSRNLFDGFITRTVAPKHKWKWDTAENDKNLVMLLDETKRDSHVNNCIITLISSLDIWTQLRMKSKFEEIFKTTPTAKKTEKLNIISMELKEILESRDIPSSSSQMVQYKKKPVEEGAGSELPAYLGLSASSSLCELQPAVLSGEWVRPRCYVCCACGEQTRDARTLSTHLATQHPNAQVQHYEIVGETLLSADILKHLYVPPSQISNRTRPPRGFRDCTKCKKSVTLEELHQHMLDCAGDTPTVRRKCRYRPFGVRRRRPRLSDNTIRKKMRKDIRSRHRQKAHMRPRPKTRTEVGDAETIRKMIADLPAKRNRITPTSVLRPRRTVVKTNNQVKHRSSEDKKSKHRPVKSLNKPNKSEAAKKQNDTDNSSTIDEDDQPLKLSATRILTRAGNGKELLRRRATINKTKKKKQSNKQDTNMQGLLPNYYITPPYEFNTKILDQNMYNHDGSNLEPSNVSRSNVLRPTALRPDGYPPFSSYCFPYQQNIERERHNHSAFQEIYQETINADLTDRVPQYQSVLESSHQWVDVKSAGPSNIRQHSSRDDNNMQSSKDHSVRGGDGSNQNNNIAQAPNMPLKHSIASLTSDTDDRGASIPNQSINHSFLLPLVMNTTFVHESADSRKIFENEATVDKVDKPPLSNNPTQSKKSKEQRPVAYNPIDLDNLSAYTPSQCDPIRSQNSMVPSFLPNESIESRAASKQTFLQDSIGLHGQLPLVDKFKSKLHVEQTHIRTGLKELTEINQGHKIAHSIKETKTETDKSKYSKTRKGLNDCIAMLRTKKGIRLDKITSEHGDDENMDCEVIDLETVDSEVTTIGSSDQTLSGSKSINITPTHLSSGQDGGFRIQRLSTDHLPAETDGTVLQQKKVHIDSDHPSPKPKQHEEEFNQTMSTCGRESSKHSPVEDAHMVSSSSSVLIKHSDYRKTDLTIMHNMRRNSHAEIQTREDPQLLHSSKVSQNIQKLIDFNVPNLTKPFREVQAIKNKKKEDMKIMREFRYRVEHEVDNQRSTPGPASTINEAVSKSEQAEEITAKTVEPAAQTIEIAAQPFSEIALSTDDSIDAKMAFPQSKVSPASRRTRRKPIKTKANLIQQSEQIPHRGQTTPQKQMVVSPQHHDLRAVGTSPIDLIMQPYNYLPTVSPTHETLPIKTPPPPPPNPIYARRESCKRVLDCSESSAAVVENKDHLSLTNAVGTSPETYAESIMNMHNLRHHSIELANSQTMTANYDKLMAYRNQYEKALMSISLTSRGVSLPHNINRDNCINDSSRYDKPNELHSLYPSNTTFVSMTHDTHGIMHVNPNALSSSVNMSSTRDTQDNYKTTQENEQFMNVHRQRSDNIEAKRGHSLKIGEHVDKYFMQESKAIKQKSTTLDTNSHALTSRRTSEVYYNRSSPYQRNGPNMNTLDHFVDMGFDKNKETHNNALRAYHESVASFAVPTATYSNNVMHMQHNAISSIPSLSCEPNVDEMAPLDLSCDAKSRNDQTLDLSKKSTDVFKDPCNIPICNEKHPDEVALNPILFRRNYIGEMRSVLSSETEHIEELVHQVPPNVSLDKPGKDNLEMSTQEFSYQQALTTSVQSANVVNSELLDKSLNNSNKNINSDDETTNKIPNTGNDKNYSNDQLQSLPPECNYSIPHDSQILNSKAIYSKDSQQEKTFLQNKKIIRPVLHVNPEAKFEDETSKNTKPCAPINTDDQNAENNNSHGWDPHPYVDHRITSPNVPSVNANDVTNQNNSTSEIKPRERNAQICDHEVFPDNDNVQIEQDAETARKIAMLPEELVKILGTIPKDHRNQLLNVLPQYVSTPLSNVENDTRNTMSSTNIQKNLKSRADTKQNISGSCDSNRLSVNTAITPSSVIPKKRHSPSHSKGRLNSSESQSAGSMMPPSFAPTLSQSSPIAHTESANNLKYSPTGSLIKANYSENLVNPTRKTEEKDWTDIKLTDESSKPAHLNKNTEVPAFTSPTPDQDVTLKLPTKQKPSNEQTASLRAVRIKTTSTKKSFSDDKQLLGSYCYSTNVKSDEKCSNSGQIIGPGFQDSHVNPTDLKYEMNKSNDQHTENKGDSVNEVILRDTIKQNTDHFQDGIKTIETEILSQTKVENNDNYTHNVPHHARLSQNECNIISHDTPQDSDQSKNTITLERSSSVPLQETNTAVDHFLEQLKSTSFPKSGITEDEVFALTPKIISPENETEKELINTIVIQFDSTKNDFTPDIKIPEKTKNTTETKIVGQSSDDNIEVQPLSSTSTENHDAKQDNELKDEESKKEPLIKNVLSLELEIKTAHKISTPNEDDSDDDVTLAVIKQNNCKPDYKRRKTTKKPGNSPGLKSKDNRSKLKVASKRQKKKLSKSPEIIQSNKLSDDIASNTIFIQPDDNSEIRFNDDKCRNIANMLPITTEIDKVKNKIKENDDDLVLGRPNEIVTTFDYDNKNEQKETTDTKMNLQPENIIKYASEQIQALPVLDISSNVELDKAYVSLDESQSKIKKTNINKSEIKCNLSNVDRNNELDLFSSILNKTKPDEKDVKDFTEISNKDSEKINPITTPIDSIPSDFQLCSEIIEVNTLPLRRSRRGKSMYVDSSYLKDSEQIEDRNKKTPLTMKRLILSRVEKEKKRISESSILEKSDDVTDEYLAITSEESEFPCVKKEKLIKRKKSPQSRRISKKIKPIDTNDVEEELSELSELSNLHSTSENNSCILRELPNAENKIAELDSCNDDLKCRAISDNNASLSENTTIVSNEKESDVAGDSLIEIKETTTSVKRKLNTNKSIDIVSSQSKKTKYHKKKYQSDFDSDDDKVLLETKQKIATEKHLLDDHDSSSISKEEEDNNGESPKGLNEANNDILKQTANASAPSETRVTCYSRSISSRRPRSSSTSFKDHANYDPYDIDFIDIIETSGPILKKKGKNASNKQSAKLHHDCKLNVPKEVINNSPHKDSKQTVTKIQPNMNNESDSDSSKSDVPLQKYVDNKLSKVDLKNKNQKNCNEFTDSTESIKTSNQTSLDIKQTPTTENSDYSNDEKPCSNNSNVEVAPTPFKSKKTTKRASTDNILCESDTPLKDDNQNTNISVDETTQKLSINKQKKTRRTPAGNDVDSAIVSNEDDQQLRSDKFMENFGFYSERIPRKSNLLASKKISETFHLIGNEKDDSYFCHKEKPSRKSAANESKKKSETGSNMVASLDSRTTTGDVVNLDVQSTEPIINTNPNESGDVTRMDDSDLDSLTAQAIMDSEEVRALENDLFSSLREAAEASAARNSFVGYQNTSDLDSTPQAPQDVTQKDPVSQTEDKIDVNLEPTKKPNKTKQNKQPGVKDKMYPDIDEIDMFEDKFDKIKRKRRSQAVAAKQVQVVAESNTSAKSRKQSERKRTTKSTKKNYQSTQVPTKGALKGFEGIKISIPTQDLNMPINVSPPRQSKKRRKTNVKRRKEVSYLDSSCSEFDEKDKSGLERDIYEFKESEDTDLFDLRPSTVMDRFRSMHNKSKLKHKEKDKAKDTEKEKLRSREKERNSEAKVSTNYETVKERNKSTTNQNEKRRKNSFSREQGQGIEKDFRRDTNYSEKHLEKCMVVDPYMKPLNDSETPNYREVNNGKKDLDSAIASTSGFIPERMDESDYESEMSSPEGDFIFYTSNDINCVCPSDNDSDDSDVERACGRLNCVNKNRNADKNAAIENIFKNNAVRCEKPDTKEPEKPRPNLDQLFDSLLETESKSNKNDIYEDQKDVMETRNIDLQKNIMTSLAHVAQHNPTEPKGANHPSALNEDIISIFDESNNTTNFHQSMPTNSKYESNNTKTDEHTPRKSDYTSSLCQNDILTDSNSMQIFSIDDKQKESIGYSLMSEESTQVNFSDIIAHDTAMKNDTNDKKISNIKSTKTGACHIANYNSEDEFDIDKPETLNRQYMHLILPAEKVSTCVQTENKTDDSDAECCNESSATKYLKGLTPSEAANTDIYTIVSAQSTQTDKLKRHESDSSKNDDFSQSKSEDEMDIRVIPRSHIRLQKYDVHENAHKSKSTKSNQTEKNKAYKSSQYDTLTDSDDDVGTDKCHHTDKEPDIVKGNVKAYRGSNSLDETPPYDVDAFTAPAARSTTDKNSPRKSDEGISTSHDYSADAFDQSLDNAGVARQRARRKCAVGKQNVLAEHWSSESEFDGVPPRPNSADSVVAHAPRRKKSRKKEGHHAGVRKASRHLAKSDSKGARGRVASGGRSEEGDTCASGSGTRAPRGPKMRARAAHYWSSEGEDLAGPQPQHGWIVGDSHKKLVTMLAHAKGRKRNNAEKHLD